MVELREDQKKIQVGCWFEIKTKNLKFANTDCVQQGFQVSKTKFSTYWEISQESAGKNFLNFLVASSWWFHTAVINFVSLSDEYRLPVGFFIFSLELVEVEN